VSVFNSGIFVSKIVQTVTFFLSIAGVWNLLNPGQIEALTNVIAVVIPAAIGLVSAFDLRKVKAADVARENEWVDYIKEFPVSVDEAAEEGK
jgi:hypothetical protein